jgi:hypothetical protein
MACNTCKNETPDCKCTTTALSINNICNPVACETEECSETFAAGCIIYNDADILCGGVVLVTAGDTVAQAIANITAYFCATEGVTADVMCGVDTVVPADTTFGDALPLVVTYFCDAIANIALTPGPQGDPGLDGNGITSFVWTSNDGAQPQGTQGTTDTYTMTFDDASTTLVLVTNGADGNNGDFILNTVEAPGVNCPYGGVKVEVIQGIDGVTVLSTDYVCNINPTYNYGLFTQTASSSFGNTVTPTSMVGTGEGSVAIAANELAVGDTFKFKAVGLLRSTLAATLTLELKLNGVVLSTIVTPVLSIDPAEIWEYEADITVRTIGATGNIYTASEFALNQTAPIDEHLIYPTLANAVVDTTILNTFDLVATYSLAGANVTLSTEVLTLIKIY